MGRLLTALAATAAVTVGALGVGAAPSAASSGRCPRGTGVTVVVDYGPLGGGVVTACDPDGAGRPATEVMGRAGFALTYVNNQPGFVCRIDGKPDESQESCASTPPSDAYWGLFWSDGDPATWKYASQGAGSLEVPEGGSIGWRFQDGGDREDPGAPPTAAATSPSPSASPTPTPHPTRNPSSPPAGPSDTAEPASPSPTPTPPASVPPGTKGSAPSPSEDATPGRKQGPHTGHDDRGKQKRDKHDKKKGHRRGGAKPLTVTATAAPSPAVAISPASGEPTSDDGSSPALTLVAGGALLLLAGAAGVIAWRRRT